MFIDKKLLLWLCITIQSVVYATVPLFKVYPDLVNQIPHVTLGDFPTPLTYCPALSQELQCTVLCKRDDLAGPVQPNGARLFGGNKVRKLEFVLADALAHGAQSIVTFGCSGSNHALATAIYGKQMGLDVTSLLSHQSNSWVVQRNLLLQELYGAQLAFYMTGKERKAAGEHFVEHCQTRLGRSPYVIPPGASMPVGVLGFINAVFELSEQLDQAAVRTVDYIYLPTGSLGTTVGLLMGLQLYGCSTKVVGVSVENRANARADVKKLFEATREYLISCDPYFACLTWNDDQLILEEQYVGRGYGLTTPEAQQAIDLFAITEGLVIEHTYTAKAAAALLHDADAGLLKDTMVLFWLTFYGDDCTALLERSRYKNLPQGFHRYFA